MGYSRVFLEEKRSQSGLCYPAYSPRVHTWGPPEQILGRAPFHTPAKNDPTFRIFLAENGATSGQGWRVQSSLNPIGGENISFSSCMTLVLRERKRRRQRSRKWPGEIRQRSGKYTVSAEIKPRFSEKSWLRYHPCPQLLFWLGLRQI